MIRLLTLTYPLTPVSEAACGGTEQMAYSLLRGLAAQPDGFEITWIGAEGSTGPVPCLTWTEVMNRYGLEPPRPALYTPDRLADLQRRCNAAALHFIADSRPSLVHNQGAWLPLAAARVKVPVLFTVHLARSSYPAGLFTAPPPALHFQCVSATQWRQYQHTACCGVIGNGIDLETYVPRRRPPAADAPLLYLGRICPEKGPHLAIAAARRARRHLWLVGAVAPFPGHREYFEREIRPALDAGIRWLPPPTLAVKRQLLQQAAAVVIPSLIDETSSLVAMEAAASGVPALALRAGALPEIVADGETGYIADTWEGLADAATPAALASITPAACRARAQQHFCARRMVWDYRVLYRRLAARAPASGEVGCWSRAAPFTKAPASHL
ncbi:MAG TPA: glycosyltransferase [Terriglobales bacterium]|jgi:glycosyltransferase involved in cell wall biosynthesis